MTGCRLVSVPDLPWRPTSPSQFALDFYASNHGPCFSHKGVETHAPTDDIAVLYRAENNKITQVRHAARRVRSTLAAHSQPRTHSPRGLTPRVDLCGA